MTRANNPVSAQELAQLPLFRGVSLSTLEELARSSPLQELAPGHVLLEPDHSRDLMYLILEGRVRVRLESDEDPIAYLDAGHCVGELSTLEGTSPSAVVVADTRCRVLAIEGPTMRALVERSHTLTKNLVGILAGRLRSDHESIRESLERQHTHALASRKDPLTGLYNRRWLDETFDRLRATDEIPRPVGLLMLDVDRFKQYNDAHGHRAGDQALRSVAEAMKASTEHGWPARYGGDEFALLLPGADLAASKEVAAHLRGAVGETRIQVDGETLLAVEISVGVSALDPSDEEIGSWIRRADEAMYDAKRAGGNCVRSR